MERILKIIVPLVYWPMVVAQFIAIMDAIHSLGIPWPMAGVPAFLIANIPLIGAATGIYGAHSVWEWPWPATFLLFGGPYLVLAICVVYELLLAKVNRPLP